MDCSLHLHYLLIIKKVLISKHSSLDLVIKKKQGRMIDKLYHFSFFHEVFLTIPFDSIIPLCLFSPNIFTGYSDFHLLYNFFKWWPKIRLCEWSHHSESYLSREHAQTPQRAGEPGPSSFSCWQALQHPCGLQVTQKNGSQKQPSPFC